MNDKIIKISKQKLIYLNYAESTTKTYIRYIDELVKSVEKISAEKIS